MRHEPLTVGSALPCLQHVPDSLLDGIALIAGVSTGELLGVQMEAIMTSPNRTSFVDAVASALLAEAYHSRQGALARKPLSHLVPAIALMSDETVPRAVASVRLFNVLHKHDLLRWRSLADISIAELSMLPKLGRRSVEDLIRTLVDRALVLLLPAWAAGERPMAPGESESDDRRQTAQRAMIGENELQLRAALKTLAAWGFAEHGARTLAEALWLAETIGDMPETSGEHRWSCLSGPRRHGCSRSTRPEGPPRTGAESASDPVAILSAAVGLNNPEALQMDALRERLRQRKGNYLLDLLP